MLFRSSASHEMVDKVVEATKIAKEMAPDMNIDGELQTDAAIVPSVYFPEFRQFDGIVVDD